MLDEPRVSVLIVSYNTKELVREALHAITGVHEIIVIDNDSADGTADMVKQDFPAVKLIANQENVGFGAANNQGLDAMTGDVALFLNSDARPVGQAISTLASLFRDSEVVGAGGRLVLPNGEEQPSACSELNLWVVLCEQLLLEKAMPGSKVFSPYWLNRRLAGQEPHEVAQCTGACLMIRPLERFNEEFFLYAEDTELCKRLATHGKIEFYRRAEFAHHLGASSTQNRWWSVAMYNRGKELYFLIHHGRTAMAICFGLNRLGALIRMLGYVPMFSPKAGWFWKVLAAPVKGPKAPP